MKVGISAVFDPAVTPHARTFMRALMVGRNTIAGLQGVRWHWLDDAADPRQGAWVARQMIAWGADVVLGHFSSDAALAAAPLYARAGIALLTPAATVECLSEHANVLRGCPSDRQLARDLLAWIVGRGWRRLHVQADASAHGQALAAAIRHATQGQGLALVNAPEQADAEVFAGRLHASREHWLARRRGGSRRPLILTDDAVSPHLGKEEQGATWVIGFDDGPDDCPAAGLHRQLFAEPPHTYYRQTLRLLHVLGALAPRAWPASGALLEALRRERFTTPLGPVAFLPGEGPGGATRIWHLGPDGLQRQPAV